jgi:large subunit ribosomal protein L1
MGKIRVKTLGLEEEEKKQKEEAKKRAEIKRQQAIAEAKREAKPEKKIETTEATASKEPEKKKKNETAKKSGKLLKKHSDKYLTQAAKVDRTKKYALNDALTLLPQLTVAKFDETVELHINTIATGIAGNVTLPHGTGKQIRIEIADYSADAKHVEEIVKKVESGQIDFDVLIATPDSMAKLARVARVLGPRGLMPNPKNGTISPKPEEVAKKFQGGQINFKTEAKFPLLHLAVGKVSFGEKKLSDNIKIAISAIQTKNIRELTLKSTMSPGIKIDTASF